MNPPKALSVLGLTLALGFATGPTRAEEHRSHGAHVHGVSHLDLVWEGALVQIGLETPAANLVGFEHAPETQAQRSALASALVTLKDGGRLFKLSPEAGCRLAEVQIEASALDGTSTTQHQDEGQDHQDGHGHGDDHEGDHGHAEHQGHADLAAEYRFECAAPDRLVQLELGLFAAFPGTQGVKVQYVGPKGQAAVELTPANPVLRF